MNKIFGHLRKFSQDHNLFSKESEIIISFSAGADSVMLLLFFSWLKKRGEIKNFSLVHFNHQTRQGENEIEALSAIRYANEAGVKLKIVELNLFQGKANFEARARELRYRYLLNLSKKNGSLVALGHHLDDSFEWSLMQLLKVSSLRKTLGIPLKRGPYIRPLLSLTKDHILSFLKKRNILYYDDSSNSDDSFERNWIRHHIVTPLKRRYPSLYKNYIFQMNELLSLYKKSELFNRTPFFGGVLIERDVLEIGKQELYPLIEKLSTKKRGTLGDRIDQIINGFKNGKIGPYQLSGGVTL